ncbi:hypothetical protein BO82DRAFT_351427 [Aspergillus uvarum CBS 121591]|uniref:Uncharacterized protein n=1 Tax=Aspergillus uvarum CBS 121591 TaxID=1448315 RepID=A0A319CQ31_9EURO|nr:hypothetical protein BO82DRAFT_351427 [Aspergillus uvarum CBS 121591]PYH85067.1 hypothetical protein BO82DRAFT_351427 [Aspergillus uvarum CBS 121591]
MEHQAFLRLRRHRREGEQESDAEATPPTVARSPLVDKSAGYASLRGPCIVTCRGIGRSSTRECCPSAWEILEGLYTSTAWMYLSGQARAELEAESEQYYAHTLDDVRWNYQVAAALACQLRTVQSVSSRQPCRKSPKSGFPAWRADYEY